MQRRRVITSLITTVAALVCLSTPAQAGREWCATDPILQFADASRVQWVVQFDSANLPSLSGPIEFSYEVPSNAGPIIVGFPSSAAPETVRIAYTGEPWDGKGKLPVTATIAMAATTRIQTVTSVRGNVAKSLDIHGNSDHRVKASAKIDSSDWSSLVGAGTIVRSVRVTGTTTLGTPLRPTRGDD